MLTLRAARLKHEWFYLGLNQEPLNKKQLSKLDCSERAPELHELRLAINKSGVFRTQTQVQVLPNLKKAISKWCGAVFDGSPCRDKDLKSLLKKKSELYSYKEHGLGCKYGLGATLLFINMHGQPQSKVNFRIKPSHQHRSLEKCEQKG